MYHLNPKIIMSWPYKVCLKTCFHFQSRAIFVVSNMTRYYFITSVQVVMEHFTIVQRIEMLKIHYQNGENAPSWSVVVNLINKFEL